MTPIFLVLLALACRFVIADGIAGSGRVADFVHDRVLDLAWLLVLAAAVDWVLERL